MDDATASEGRAGMPTTRPGQPKPGGRPGRREAGQGRWRVHSPVDLALGPACMVLSSWSMGWLDREKIQISATLAEASLMLLHRLSTWPPSGGRCITWAAPFPQEERRRMREGAGWGRGQDGACWAQLGGQHQASPRGTEGCEGGGCPAQPPGSTVWTAAPTQAPTHGPRLPAREGHGDQTCLCAHPRLPSPAPDRPRGPSARAPRTGGGREGSIGMHPRFLTREPLQLHVTRRP